MTWIFYDPVTFLMLSDKFVQLSAYMDKTEVTQISNFLNIAYSRITFIRNGTPAKYPLTEYIWGETGRHPASLTGGSVQFEPEGIQSTRDGPLSEWTIKVPSTGLTISNTNTTQTFRLLKKKKSRNYKTEYVQAALLANKIHLWLEKQTGRQCVCVCVCILQKLKLKNYLVHQHIKQTRDINCIVPLNCWSLKGVLQKADYGVKGERLHLCLIW